MNCICVDSFVKDQKSSKPFGNYIDVWILEAEWEDDGADSFHIFEDVDMRDSIEIFHFPMLHFVISKTKSIC